MNIEHIAIWVSDLDESIKFFVEFFDGNPGEKYLNNKSNFKSCFISFSCGARLEIMQKPGLSGMANEKEQFFGYSHIAFSVGSKDKVDELTKRLRNKNYKIISEPRFTGDGYYESCILDNDNNRIEITI
ncbi:MAG TPA: VOC family protein [Clostridia bacterium]